MLSIPFFLINSIYAEVSLVAAEEDEAECFGVPLFVITGRYSEEFYNVFYTEDGNEYLPHYLQPCSPEEAPDFLAEDGSITRSSFIEAMDALLADKAECPFDLEERDYRKSYVQLGEIYYSCELGPTGECKGKKNIRDKIEEYLQVRGFREGEGEGPGKSSSLVKKMLGFSKTSKDFSNVVKNGVKTLKNFAENQVPKDEGSSVDSANEAFDKYANLNKGTSAADTLIACTRTVMNALKEKEEEAELAMEIEKVEVAMKLAILEGIETGGLGSALSAIEDRVAFEKEMFSIISDQVCGIDTLKDLREYLELTQDYELFKALFTKKRYLEKKLKELKGRNSSIYWASCGVKLTKIAAKSNTVSNLVGNSEITGILGNIGSFSGPLSLALSLPEVYSSFNKIYLGTSIALSDDKVFNEEITPILAALKAQQSLTRDAIDLAFSAAKTGTIAVNLISPLPMASLIYFGGRLVKDYVIDSVIDSEHSKKVDNLIETFRRVGETDFTSLLISDGTKGIEDRKVVVHTIKYETTNELLHQDPSFLSFTILAKLAEDMLVGKDHVESFLLSRLGREHYYEMVQLLKSGYPELVVDPLHENLNLKKG